MNASERGEMLIVAVEAATAHQPRQHPLDQRAAQQDRARTQRLGEPDHAATQAHTVFVAQDEHPKCFGIHPK